MAQPPPTVGQRKHYLDLPHAAAQPAPHMSRKPQPAQHPTRRPKRTSERPSAAAAPPAAAPPAAWDGWDQPSRAAAAADAPAVLGLPPPPCPHCADMLDRLCERTSAGIREGSRLWARIRELEVSLAAAEQRLEAVLRGGMATHLAEQRQQRKGGSR